MKRTILTFLILLISILVSTPPLLYPQDLEGRSQEEESYTIQADYPSPVYETRLPDRFYDSLNDFELLRDNSDVTARIFEKIPGIYTRQSEYGSGGPTIRGFFGNSVLLLFDGIRLNTCITKNGNNQYMGLVDNNYLMQIDILRGSFSVLYGSDAIGGIVNMIPEYPAFSEDNFNFEGRAKALYNYANNGYILHINLNPQLEGVSLITGGAYSRLDDVLPGANSPFNPQDPSGFSFFSHYSNMGIALNENHHLYLGVYLHHNYNIQRFDRLHGKAGTQEEGTFLQYSLPEFFRDMVYLRYSGNKLNNTMETMEVTLFYQYYLSSSESIKRNNPDTASYNEDVVHMAGFSSFTQFNLLSNLLLSCGLDGYFQFLFSLENEIDRINNTQSRLSRGKYQDDSDYHTFNLYLTLNYQVLSWFDFISGASLSYLYVNSPLHSTIPEFEDLTKHEIGYSGLLAFSFFPRWDYQFNLILSSGYRFPNLDDLTILGLSKNNFEIPNPNLLSEQSLNLEINTNLNILDIVQISVSGFLVYLFNRIEKVPALYQGSTEYQELAVLQKQNVARALYYGGELKYEATIGYYFKLYGILSYAVGQDLSHHQWMSRTMPLMGLNGIRFEYLHLYTSFSLDFYVQYAAKQTRLSSEDLLDNRIPEGGTPGWYTLNFKFWMMIYDYVDLVIEFNNILDATYRMHGAGLQSPGRHFVVSLMFSY